MQKRSSHFLRALTQSKKPSSKQRHSAAQNSLVCSLAILLAIQVRQLCAVLGEGRVAPAQARQLLTDTGGSIEDAVTLHFAGHAATAPTAEQQPQAQLRAIIGWGNPQQLQQLLREAGEQSKRQSAVPRGVPLACIAKANALLAWGCAHVCCMKQRISQTVLGLLLVWQKANYLPQQLMHRQAGSLSGSLVCILLRSNAVLCHAAP